MCINALKHRVGSGRSERRRGTQRFGAVLLEAIVALAVLTTVVGSDLALASESWRAVSRAEQAAEDEQRASALLDAVAMWPRQDLDRHLGERVEGPWLMWISRDTPVLYVVTLADSSNRAVILQTTLYRPDSSDAAAL